MALKGVEQTNKDRAMRVGTSPPMSSRLIGLSQVALPHANFEFELTSPASHTMFDNRFTQSHEAVMR